MGRARQWLEATEAMRAGFNDIVLSVLSPVR